VIICGLVFEHGVNLVLLFSISLHNRFYGICCASYLVAAVSMQSLWSLILAILDVYAILVRRHFRNPKVVSLFAIGDGVRKLLLWI
jgi:hypothetical protein